MNRSDQSAKSDGNVAMFSPVAGSISIFHLVVSFSSPRLSGGNGVVWGGGACERWNMLDPNASFQNRHTVSVLCFLQEYNTSTLSDFRSDLLLLV